MLSNLCHGNCRHENWVSSSVHLRYSQEQRWFIDYRCGNGKEELERRTQILQTVKQHYSSKNPTHLFTLRHTFTFTDFKLKWCIRSPASLSFGKRQHYTDNYMDFILVLNSDLQLNLPPCDSCWWTCWEKNWVLSLLLLVVLMESEKVYTWPT